MPAEWTDLQQTIVYGGGSHIVWKIEKVRTGGGAIKVVVPRGL